jgi:hypothetical protein
VFESGSSQHQAVKERDGDAGIHSTRESIEHPVGAGTMNVEIVAQANVGRRQDEWLPIHHKSDMANQPFIEDCRDGVVVVSTPIGETLNSRTGRRR